MSRTTTLRTLQRTAPHLICFRYLDCRQMRYTKRVSVWPVGFAGGMRYERPLAKDGRVVGWSAVFKPNRTFAIDMAGFAVNIRLLLDKPSAEFAYTVPSGEIESYFLAQLVNLTELEPVANNCTAVNIF